VSNVPVLLILGNEHGELGAAPARLHEVPDDAHLLFMVVSPSNPDERHLVRVVDVRESKDLC